MAPKDILAEGTWIAVNERGMAACLLNRYDPAPPGRRTRGDIVVEAMSGVSVADAVQCVAALPLNEYAPFTCLLVDAADVTKLDWTGASWTRSDIAIDVIMLTSSSWRLDEVKAQRERYFQQVWAAHKSDRDRLAAFHCQTDFESTHWTPMMLRPQSQTKSITQIELGPTTAKMRYWRRESAIARGLSMPDTNIRLAIERS
ncbi:MAG: NRDE family protein [Rhodospirillales bacterium]|nr:NRDE family protein [Rhodospirillales bacterium]